MKPLGPPSHCTAECAECPALDEGTESGSSAVPMRGGSLSRAAAAYFLLPVGLGITGAALAGGSHLGQLLGGALGLVAGMALATAVARRRGGPQIEKPAGEGPLGRAILGNGRSGGPVSRPRTHTEEA